MVFGDILAIFGFAVSALVFVWLAREARSKHLSIASYLLGDRSATARDYGTSMVAASTSLATVMLFFLANAQHYGLTLLFCGATYLGGQALFIKILGRANIRTSDLSTNAEFWRIFANAPRSAFVIGILTVTTFLIILFVELYIGSVIIGYYLLDLKTWGKAIAFTILGSVVVAYVRIGGMRVVFRTDAWQLRLMLASMAALIIFAITVPNLDSKEVLLTSVFTVDATFIEVVLFWCWIGLLNITLPFTQLSSWQRIAATKSVAEAWNGLKRQTGSFFVLWFVPVIAFVILSAKGYSLTDLPALFDAMRQGPMAIEGVLYPILFVGFASALFSTADTALIALQFAAADESLTGKFFRTGNERTLRRRLLVTMLAMILLLALIFGLAEAKLGAWFIPLIFAIFGQLAVIAPQIIYALCCRMRGQNFVQFSKLGEFANVVAILLAWLVIIGGTILRANEYLPSRGSQEVATFLGVAISLLGLLVGHLTRHSATEKPE